MIDADVDAYVDVAGAVFLLYAFAFDVSADYSVAYIVSLPL